MTSEWPSTTLDPVRRLHVVAAGVRCAAVTERVVGADLNEVWTMLTEFEGGFARVQPDMRQVQVLSRVADRVELRAISRHGMRARLVGVERPGWCWLQSRFLIIAMAATAEATGGTRVALTGGVRVPSRAAVVPIGVRREAGRSLDSLERILEERSR